MHVPRHSPHGDGQSPRENKWKHGELLQARSLTDTLFSSAHFIGQVLFEGMGK